ncbi:MAG TPA: isoprenylcysteine carboxylmethyltransferase family protein [Gemmatimonadaceae bacterium]|nr:isoprenylcysteine carboxylmethyltransferase family protein [Gemmatimonadaceae bacterium]
MSPPGRLLRGDGVLLVKNLLFTILVPGTVTVVVPYLILRGTTAAIPQVWGAVQILGLVLGGAGLLIYVRCHWDFAAHGRGTPAPVDPPRILVVRGLYRYVRNPMYLGVLLILLGEVLFFESLVLLLFVLPWLLLVHLFVIFHEEPSLRRRFGDSYEAYASAVRRWVPGPPYRRAEAVDA